ncbi:Histidine kinase [Polaribacter sp. KT25b]|uniref:histidine kinase n=1 Tax=Polaribacter sp. KT25b TaxID=1855336 RepID=UPI00087BCA80|nr:histidine kinase [Polaribacter sp. KT25b]SDS48899.1 Histidine kinase [Polaribacter sp. KT25b]
MASNNLFLKFKQHRQYFFISFLFIAIYFIGSALITPKITSVTENLVEDLIQGNLKDKENVVFFEFNQLNSYLNDAEQIIKYSNKTSTKELKEKLVFTAGLALENQNISNTFIVFSKNDTVDFYSPNKNALYTKEIHNYLSKKNVSETKNTRDTILTSKNKVLYRKTYAIKLKNDTTVTFGYDVDLLNFWNYFSEKYKGDGGYTVVTNKDGVCILHPDTTYIGKKLEGYFDTISIEKVLQSTIKINGYYVPRNKNILTSKAVSEFLDLEVLRYYQTIKISNTSLITVVSFPVQIHLKETTQSIQRYFSWISSLAFATFMLILIVYRLQLKKEFVENLRVLEEKEQLIYANEKYQKENAVLQLNQLKKKMNPHFLFNSLNSLHVLIDLNPELSQQFVIKLADVYRYLLEERDGNLISVKKEITFLQQYVFLQEIRFNNSLNVSIINKSDAKVLQNKIPFLSLETLVENAIKHNNITKQNPLFIEVIILNDKIKVINNYMPRKQKDENSHQIGLTYLENTYQYYQIKNFNTAILDGKFICTLPFINVK